MGAEARFTGVSMFSSGGIGDLALRAHGVEVLVASELLPDRASVLQHNFPEIDVIVGDIGRKMGDFIDRAKARLDGRGLDILFATPPCQGMSKNGRGKLLQRLNDGSRVLLDDRNQLILHALTVARELEPRLVVFENVPEMANTLIRDRTGAVRPIMEVVVEELGEAYEGSWEVIEFADYGVPQRRKRLISVFTSDPSLQAQLQREGTLLPPRTHAAVPGDGLLPWVSVSEALKDVPPLDAGSHATATSETPYHRVPILDDDKYFWVSNTPVGKGAFDNQCVSPTCGHDGNATHGSTRDELGVNRFLQTTPIQCERCVELLPRPWVRDSDGRVRLMKGYTSA